MGYLLSFLNCNKYELFPSDSILYSNSSGTDASLYNNLMAFSNYLYSENISFEIFSTVLIK